LHYLKNIQVKSLYLIFSSKDAIVGQWMHGTSMSSSVYLASSWNLKTQTIMEASYVAYQLIDPNIHAIMFADNINLVTGAGQ
jgi:hypothetical protein